MERSKQGDPLLKASAIDDERLDGRERPEGLEPVERDGMTGPEVEVDQGCQVISEGLQALVRHEPAALQVKVRQGRQSAEGHEPLVRDGVAMADVEVGEAGHPFQCSEAVVGDSSAAAEVEGRQRCQRCQSNEALARDLAALGHIDGSEAGH